MGFSYPLHLSFHTAEEHIQHVKNNKEFYSKILEPDVQIKYTKKLEEVKKEKLQLVETLKAQKIVIAEGKEQVENAEKLVAKVKQYREVEPTAKGKTFEEQILYMLKSVNRNYKLGFTVDGSNRTGACDIRIEYPGLGVIGIEAKSKQRITHEDIVKFNRDRVQNNFVGGVFWSKSAKIHGTSDKTDTENYLELFSENKCLFLKGDDFERCAQVIFAYAKFLLLLKNQKPAEDKGLTEMISKMFEMILSQYEQFGRLKKEVQNLDVLFKKNLEMVNYLCKTHKLKNLNKTNFQFKDTSLVIVYKKDVHNMKAYENRELSILKSKETSFFGKRLSFQKKRSNPVGHSNINNKEDVPVSKKEKSDDKNSVDQNKNEPDDLSLNCEPLSTKRINLHSTNEIVEEVPPRGSLPPRDSLPPIEMRDDEEEESDEENTFDTFDGSEEI